ncbi:hypothetical protein CMQ_3737 [Grosmannia clavigera kw1407]|uniref:Uncharacterized protein n=1 Tax=Grosmannia clavigera (strain kw1407 / UAMH 11150) TaxID=655863 RepID=F0X8V2_GROCL|nr:uncharacterized protein CMQ_3737 [Grosmannia clavigera kw1407]EFX05668.1 hypothetical protein CMQ_3737 [Grosmannia clavigera kw1407]
MSAVWLRLAARLGRCPSTPLEVTWTHASRSNVPEKNTRTFLHDMDAGAVREPTGLTKEAVSTPILATDMHRRPGAQEAPLLAGKRASSTP